MGIPSFYRRLSLAHKGLIGKQRGTKTAALYFDFNCLIYSVVRSPSMPVYSASTHREWEKTLLEEVNKYVIKVWNAAGSPSQVFLGVDGVVPIAKIKQQRLRRFKSAWLAKEEVDLGIRVAGESWDTNAITPGTAFMDALGLSLQDLCSRKGKGWSVSSAQEPGEGEHKIMQRLRGLSPSSFDGSLIIYGLDADLILLTLLNAVGAGYKDVYLMREDTEFDRNQQGEVGFSYLSMNKLSECLWKDFQTLSPERQLQRIQSYVCGMSLLGNDFLPHSLSIHVREDGHEILSRDLQKLEQEGKFLLQQDLEGRQLLHIPTLIELLTQWASQEESAILHGIRRKQQMRSNYNQVDAAQVLQARPMEWDVERECVVWKKQDNNKSRIEFLPHWKTVYRQKWLKNIPVDALAKHYVFGLQWIYDYYSGQRPVTNIWMYPANLPPLWSDLLLSMPATIPSLGTVYQEIQPQEQLSMVLPLSSWYLIRNKTLRNLPMQYPQYWPRSFLFYSVGKRLLWECEPDICHLPLPIVKNC